MYARNVTFRLKSNMQSDYTHTFENQILPLLRKQKGFKDEITAVQPRLAGCGFNQSVGAQEQCRRLQHPRLPAKC